MIDRGLCLPRRWIADEVGRQATHIPPERAFALPDPDAEIGAEGDRIDQPA
ncbi:hypothetical protein OG320_24870 [Microbispora sp. NBC_01189]|uniref:hypothetical protein n=1 Tax=Microbispora sp. NBC_01189 TaxID=2903583 RepID=UPI002E125EEC|nr:hypothetical protein OG320_24870 [Microbispora sp. NBC_01189]